MCCIISSFLLCFFVLSFCFLCQWHELLVECLAKFVNSRFVDIVDPTLIQVDEEDDVVAEASETMSRRHSDDEGKNVVDEGVEGLNEMR